MEENNIISGFNEAQLEVLRGHQMQDLLNQCKLNLEAFNEQFQQFNYKMVLILLSNLFSETSSKLTPNELKLGTKYQKSLDVFITKHPIHKNIKRQGRIFIHFDSKAFNILKGELFSFELFLRKAREDHGFNSPKKVEEYY